MIRITLLTLLIAYLSAYAWREWFRSACWLVLLMSIFQHPDMPKAIAGVPGLNHWNFLFLNVVLSWLANRNKDSLQWEMPRHLNVLLFFYFSFIVISVIRYFSDMTGILDLKAEYGWDSPLGISAVNEYLINCFKWVLPSIIIFDGCRRREQYYFAMLMLALMFFFLAVQVIKAMKFGSLAMSGEGLQRKALKVISSNVGFHRVNISMMMSGAFWAVFCLKEFVSLKRYYFFLIPACICIFLAMAMTGGRTGYVTWLALGFIFCVFKWRKYLWLVPLILAGIITFAPSTVERITQGFVAQDSTKVETHVEVDFNEGAVDTRSITSGRVLAWPLVWESIMNAPFLGYGRESMKNIGISRQIMIDYGEGEIFPHPHNAYLQWIQDNGFIGAVPVFLFYLLVVKYSWSLFKGSGVRIYTVTGGVCFSLVFAFLFASVGSQTFYPREGAVGMWVSIALMLRVYVEREKVNQGKESLLIFPGDDFYHKYFVKI